MRDEADEKRMKETRDELSWLPRPIRHVGWRLFLSLRSALQTSHGLLDRQEFFMRAFYALSFNKIDGDYVEFGCHGGVTFALAYHASRRIGYRCKLWGFDSFLGLPAQKVPEDEHPRWIQGTMHTELNDFHNICRKNDIPRSAYEVVPGYYDETLVSQDSSVNLPLNICMAYVDCDLYSSALAVLRFLLPRLKHGMILAFDDYYCWSSTQVSGERRACTEVFANNVDWRLVPYIQYGWHGMSFVTEKKRLLHSA